MTAMTEQEFLSIWQKSNVQPQTTIEYRLYHDQDGYPLFYSMEHVPGTWIVVDQETFLNGPKHIKVIDGKIVEKAICWTKKLAPAQQGISCDPWDVCVVVDTDQPHVNWRLKHEEL